MNTPTRLLAGLAVLALCVVSSTGQETTTPDKQHANENSVNGLVELETNAQGHREFRREKDGAVMVLVPGGKFRKRVYVGDPLAPDDTFWVETQPFLIDKYETTNAQVLKYLKARDGLTVKDGEVFDGDTRLGIDHKWGLQVDNGKFAVREGFEKHPSVGTTGHLALAYAKWIGGDLPYGFEFEKAAAGETGQMFPWGDVPPERQHANFYLYGPRSTQAVGSHPGGVSPYGVHDMAGNVYDRAYWFETENDIGASSLPTMLKGGSWVSPHWANLRCVDRCGQGMDEPEGSVGFRCVIRDPKVLNGLGVKAEPTLRMHDDVDAAFKEASRRNVPIYLFLCFETCGQCDRVRAEVFTDPDFIEYMNKNAIVLIGHNPGDGWQDSVEGIDASILFPGCRAENLYATFDYFCRTVNTRKVPKDIIDFKMSPGQFALNPYLELQEEPEQLMMKPESAFPKGGGKVDKFIEAMKEAQQELGKGQSREDYLAGKPGPKVTWKPPFDDE